MDRSDPPSATSHPEAAPKRRMRLPIATVLVAGFGTLMLVAVASVLALGLLSAGVNTLSLLRDKATLTLDNVTVRIRHQLDPIVDQAAFLARLIEEGELSEGDSARMFDSFRAALAATPQVTGIAFIDRDLNSLRVGRFDGRMMTEYRRLEETGELEKVMNEAIAREITFWTDPVWVPDLDTTLIALQHPVERDGEFYGLIIIGVSLADLSAFLAELRMETGTNAFVLFDDTHLLAHPALTEMDFDMSSDGRDIPLPRYDEVGDPILAQLWNTEEWQREDVGDFSVTELPGDHILLTRPMASYGSRPWTVGILFPAEEVTEELRRFGMTGAVGLVILVIAVLFALLIGMPISRKIRRLADAATGLATLDLSRAQPLPDSRFRELAAAASAFNSMIVGLRWFETYVPRTLVARLMRIGPTADLASEDRIMTVMFTDIRGFSRLSETMSAAETARLLNDHFALIAGCIEKEGGTVDKFIGDAVMAFWGAPEAQPDHAARALRAARDIFHATAVCDPEEEDRPPIRLRVSVHTGPAVVGNIGSPSRINYTIVGDTVNTAARIDSLAAELQRDDEECLILTSAETLKAAGGDICPARPLGPHALRGRSGTVEIFRLEP
ncbi:adenylate/guanylate cyclase domain-containing protein [Inquilinus sp. CAU 1745]|uniref:adenylate/guanylate cyclase domain-containing protein n=1 Tax=Inquilinus sp. CAU 1745 TaxID=3140369 RepID=UPI00325B1243